MKPITNSYYEKELGAINFHEKFDYVLVISPEAIDEDILKKIKVAYPEACFILYMWDSIRNKTGRDNSRLFGFFNHVYSFDHEDCDKYPVMKFRPLFSRSTSLQNENADYSRYDLSFIGTVHSDRYKICMDVKKKAEQLGLSTFFYLYMSDKKLYWINKLSNKHMKDSKIGDFSFVPLREEDVIKSLSASKSVLDIQHPKQKGLTMRTIEVLGARRKLLTTNAEIVKYDFYNDSNFMCIDRERPCIDPEFFAKPYKDLDPGLYFKYSIQGWLQELLQI